MLWEKHFAVKDAKRACADMIAAWKDPNLKVFVLYPDSAIQDVKAFWEALFPDLGQPALLAEDVNVGDRSNQRTGEVWAEIRYDPRFPDAYRHSANAQPLHTDGSYIPGFPNSSLLACVKNAGVGGETTFVDSKDIVKAMQEEAPDLLAALRKTEIPHARTGDRKVEYVIGSDPVNPLVNWNYYCVDDGGNPSLRTTADAFFSYLLESPKIKAATCAVKLTPGSMIAWKDRELLHGRNSFQATATSDRFIWKCAFDVGRFA